jgi:hypothetical protein
MNLLIRLEHERFFTRVRKQSQGPQFISLLAATGAMENYRQSPVNIYEVKVEINVVFVHQPPSHKMLANDSKL